MHVFTSPLAALCAACFVSSLAACDDAATSVERAPAEAPAVTTMALSVPVTVANGVSNPVPTFAVGTTNVDVRNTVRTAQAGTWGVAVTNDSLAVDARQSGYWGVEVTNSALDVRGVVGAQQDGAWTVALDGTSDVAIVNTPTVELAAGARVSVDALPPVTLTGAPEVTLAGTPTVVLAGEPAVHVDGDVFVTNTEEAPIPVRDVGAGRSTPWAAQRIVNLAEGQIGQVVTILEVPLGKRLVIEHIDAFIQVDSGDGALAAGVRSTVGGEPVQFTFPFTSKVELGGVDRHLVAQATQLHADPETEVGVELMRTASVGAAVGRVTLSGRLVDVE